MRKSFSALAICVILLGACAAPSTPTGTTETTNETAPPTTETPSVESPSLRHNADWIVSDIVHLTDKTVVVGGDLIIKGTLVLEDVTLHMDGLQGRIPKIEVIASGRLELQHSNISSASTERGYYFIFRPGSVGLIEDSIIEGIQANDESFGTGEVHQHANLGGLTILADGFTLRNSTVRNATGDTRGILVAEASNVLIEGNIISNNPRDGIRLADCSDVILRDNRLIDNGTYGIKLMNCSNSIIENNLFSGNSQTPQSQNCGAIFLEFGTKDVTVSRNEISNNERHGIVLPSASRIKIQENTISGNSGYGVWVYGPSNDNEICNNILFGNRLEGIYIYPNEGLKHEVSDNEITYPPFLGNVDDFEKAWVDDFFILVLPDESAVEASFSFSANASYDGSQALRMDYTSSINDSQLSIFGTIGQDWSNYKMVEFWFKPDEDVMLDLEFAEHDGDVWFYSWCNTMSEISSWNRLETPLSDCKLRPRSTGDGKLNLKGIGYYRLTLDKLQSTGQQRSILFDNIRLTK